MSEVNTYESVSSSTDIMKDDIMPTVNNMIISRTSLLDRIEKKNVDTFGRKFLIKYAKSGNVSAFFANEWGTLLDGKARSWAEGYQTLRHLYAPVRLSNVELDLAAGKKGAFVDLYTGAFEDTAKCARGVLNSYVWGDGSGSLGTVVSSSYDNVAYTAIIISGSTLKFQKGQNLRFDSDTDDYEVVAINHATSTITVAGNATTDAAGGETIYNRADYDAGYDNVIWGLGIHVATSNGVHSLYQGLSRSVTGNEFLKAYINAVSGVLTPNVIMQHLDYIERETEGEIPDLIIGSQGTINSFKMLAESMSQPVETMMNEFGTRATYRYIRNGTPINVEAHLGCPTGYLYFLCTKYLKVAQTGPMKWQGLAQGKFQTDKATDSIWGRMVWRLNIFCTDNRAQSVMTGVTENAIA